MRRREGVGAASAGAGAGCSAGARERGAAAERQDIGRGGSKTAGCRGEEGGTLGARRQVRERRRQEYVAPCDGFAMGRVVSLGGWRPAAVFASREAVSPCEMAVCGGFAKGEAVSPSKMAAYDGFASAGPFSLAEMAGCYGFANGKRTIWRFVTGLQARKGVGGLQKRHRLPWKNPKRRFRLQNRRKPPREAPQQRLPLQTLHCPPYERSNPRGASQKRLPPPRPSHQLREKPRSVVRLRSLRDRLGFGGLSVGTARWAIGPRAPSVPIAIPLQLSRVDAFPFVPLAVHEVDAQSPLGR